MKIKSNILLVFTFISILNFICLADQSNAPKIQLPENSFDFKEVYEGSDIEHSFKVLNKGTKPLSIDKVETG